MPPRPKGLTAADRETWRAFVVHVAPLPGRAVPAEAAAPVPPPTIAVLPQASAPAAASLRAVPTAALQVGTAPAGLDKQRWRDLRRGRLRPERTLDLHGSRLHEAHGAVRGFLHAALADGLRCVAIVTGKGSAPEGGALRRELPHWLNAPDLRPLLLGLAHPHAANPGAVHVLLRRPRA